MAGVNVLNLPKPYKDFDQNFVIDCLLNHKLAELRSAQKVQPAVAASAALRGVIIPSEGKRFAIGDYSSVEPCCLFTIARQWNAVEALRAKKNIYIEFGKQLYGRTIDKHNEVKDYTLCKGVILGAGYGLGADNFVVKLQAEGASATEAEIRRAHGAYREIYSQVPKLWNGIGEAMKEAIRYPGRWFAYNDIPWFCDGYWLTVTLPGGRALHYPNARLQPGKFSDEVVYEGWMRVDGRPVGWGDVRTWGARAVENLCQAICRDVMAEDELEVEALPGWQMVMTIYDELVAEFPASLPDGDGIKAMLGIMNNSPLWLPAMPVRAEGFEAARYRKD